MGNILFEGEKQFAVPRQFAICDKDPFKIQFFEWRDIMAVSALASKSIDTSRAWFCAPFAEPGVDLEGNMDGQSRVAHFSFARALKAYEAAGHRMMTVRRSHEGEKDIIYGFNVDRVMGFHDPRVTPDMQGRESAITFKGTCYGLAATIGVRDLAKKILEAGGGANFLLLERANMHATGTTLSAINFDGVPYATDGKGGAAIYRYGIESAPLYVAQTPDQIQSALKAGIPFAVVPLPEPTPVPRDDARDRRVHGIADSSMPKADGMDLV